MAQFTAIPQVANPQLDWSHEDFLNELRKAHSERAQAVGQSAVDEIDAADNVDVQHKDFWLAMQNFVATYCTQFVNDGNDPDWDPTGETGADVLDNYAFFSEFMTTVTGKTSFRRATAWDPDGGDDWTDMDDAMYSFGVMQEGDIIGPWIFDDLQKAFDAMRRRYYSASGSSRVVRSGVQAANSYGGFPDCESLRTAALAVWEADSYSSDNNRAVLYMAYRTHQSYGSNPYVRLWEGYGYKSAPQATNIDTVTDLTYDWNLFCRNTAIYGDFADLLGYADEDTWFEQDSGAGASSSTVTAGTMGDNDIWPPDIDDAVEGTLDCGATDPWSTMQSVGVWSDNQDYSGFIISWVFSHTL